MRVLDAFAGAGGFSLGFHMAGYEISGAIERDLWAAQSFAHNHPEATVIQSDIEIVSDDELTNQVTKPDIIIGGPPCQGFSICRQNAGDPKDPRNTLFEEFLRLGQIFEPRAMIMENVPQLLTARTSSGKNVVQIIKDELESIGYYVYHRILEATDYGVPQIRKRLFVIAAKRELRRPFPPATHLVIGSGTKRDGDELAPVPTLWDAISDLPQIKARQGAEEMDYDKPAVNKYQRGLRKGSMRLYNHVAMRHSQRMEQRFASIRWGESVSDAPADLAPRSRNGNGMLSDKRYDQNNRRMHPDRPCHTVPASFYANFIHPFLHRNFTAREGARIQSFPDWFRFLGKPTVVSHKLLAREGRHSERYLCQYNQIGNAVPPLMGKALAENLKPQV